MYSKKNLKGKLGDLMMLFFGSIVILVIGACMLLRPDVIYQLTESWKSNAADEPSRLYIISTRFGGVMFLLVGLLGAVTFFIS